MKPKNKNSHYHSLREEFPFFEYQSYSFQFRKQMLEVSFLFNLADQFSFNPKISIPKRHFINWEQLTTDDLNNLVFHIGMIELISYWKTACPPKLIIRPHLLDSEQVEWWKNLYFHGLGEFFYLNGIHPEKENFLQIQSEGESLKPLAFDLNAEEIIVPVGGGKDSVVTLELLKQGGFKLRPMALNPRPAIKRTIETSGFSIDKSVVVNRTIDPLLLALNDKGFLNGHTPFSALLAFVNLLVATLTRSPLIALSNESSANQSTVPGSTINHQYSKSFEFEEDFSNYVKKYIHPAMRYFSFLRPLNELQIAGLFSGFPAHFNGFRSCNAGSKVDEWCGECPKCLFTDIMLAPFLTPQKRFGIFRKNLLDDAHLESIFDELTGKSEIKPFECVGTPDEIQAALRKLAETLPENQHPYLLRKFTQSNLKKSPANSFDALMNQINTEHLVPDDLAGLLKAEASGPAVAFRHFLEKELRAAKKILVLGLGREGRSTLRTLLKYFPGMQLAVADKNPDVEHLKEFEEYKLLYHTGENYLDALPSYDLVIKSPGIKLDRATMQPGVRITSQTALFMKFFRDQTIGVTGTKGKSTTASLISHILTEAGKDSIILGNIGIPAFDRVDRIRKRTVIVYELSAHQLQDVKISPHVAVLLNIFPEHLDHFDTYEAYREAKLNIARFQQPGDHLITNNKLSALAGEFESTLVDAEKALTGNLHDAIKRNVSELRGIHNHYNIGAAILAVQLVGVEQEQAAGALRHFKTLPHRLELIGTYAGIQFYNDSISTVPESTMAAVSTLSGVKTLILGGFDRGLDYTGLVEFLRESKIETYILLGKAGDTLFSLFNNNPKPGQQYIRVEDLKEAFRIIPLHTPKGSICLLSPAAASYDQFHNFEHRGDLFRSLAQSL